MPPKFLERSHFVLKKAFFQTTVSSWSKIWNRCLNSRNNSVILSLYWFKWMFSPVVRILFRQRKWTVSSLESCVFHKDNFNLHATYGVVILSDKSFAALQHFVQIIQVQRNIHKKGKVLHLERQGFASIVRWNSNTGLHFFHEVFNFLT